MFESRPLNRHSESFRGCTHSFQMKFRDRTCIRLRNKSFGALLKSLHVNIQPLAVIGTFDKAEYKSYQNRIRSAPYCMKSIMQYTNFGALGYVTLFTHPLQLQHVSALLFCQHQGDSIFPVKTQHI